MESEVIVWLVALAVVAGILVIGLLRLRWERFVVLWGLVGPLLVGILSSGGVYQVQQDQRTQAEQEVEAAGEQVKTVGALGKEVAAAAEGFLKAVDFWPGKGPSASEPTRKAAIDAAWLRLNAAESSLKEAVRFHDRGSDEP